MSNYGTFGENNPVWRGISRIADMMLMGILFFISCLPLVTIGAALSGFYYAAMDTMRKEDGYIFKRYFTAFGKNFKKATLIWLILLVTGGVLGMDVYFWILNSDMSIAPVMMGISVILCIAWLMTFIFAFPLQARFENKVSKTLENALLLSISHLPFTIVMILLILIVAYMCYISWLAVLIMVLIGNGVVGYLVVRYYEINFKKWGYIAEDDGKIKDDDFDFEVEIDYDKLYSREAEGHDDVDGYNDVEDKSEQTNAKEDTQDE